MAEDSLLQDNPDYDVRTDRLQETGNHLKKSLLRIIQFDNRDNEFKLKHEYLYQMDTDIPSFGVSEILAINENILLVMERAWHNKKNTIRIYKVIIDPTKNETSTLSVQTSWYQPRVLEKTLILDLDELVPYLGTSFPKLDNFEAMSFGPKTKDGNQTLLLATDSNFKSTQINKFLLLEVIDPKLFESTP